MWRRTLRIGGLHGWLCVRLSCFGLSCFGIVCLPIAVTRAAEPVLRSDKQFPGEEGLARQARRLLADHCWQCHGPDEAEGDLRLDRSESFARVVQLAKPAIAPGDLAESELIRRVRRSDDQRMPPEGEPLDADQIALLERWIQAGAPWSDHWAFRPLAYKIPRAKAGTGEPPRGSPPSNIDRFVWNRASSSGLAPNVEAPPEQLVRRLYFDLLGLPPTPRQIDRFLADRRPDAYERLVDRLLASPRFGERWGRIWLDKARYADSDGYEKDRPRPTAWHYRDWVIHAINGDLPVDRFTVEQLAGDLLPGADPGALLATAMNRQTLTNTEGGTDQEQFRVAAVMDRTEMVGTVWLGVTVGCARCHTHKYDPISHREYYQLLAFFDNADEQVRDIPASLIDPRLAVRGASAESPTKQVKARVMGERLEDRRETHVLRRGEFKQPLEPVSPGTLAVLPSLRRSEDSSENARIGDDQLERHRPLNRLDLANWLVDGRNPLVPRVLANHVWQNLFGTGLVRTPGDFGVRGDPPTHPDLLDYLAERYLQLGWSRKALIREIVCSHTYRQSSAWRDDQMRRDPANRLLTRQNRFRLDAEVLRDNALAVAGTLSTRIGGPSVFPPMAPEAAAVSYANNFQWETSHGDDANRRGMYTFFKRTAPYPTFMTFDCPDANVTSVKRNRSNTPLGALTLLNNQVFVQAARDLATGTLSEAARVEASAERWEPRPGDSQDRDDRLLCRLVRRAIGREPSPAETAALCDLLHASRAYYQKHADEALVLMARTEETGVSVEELMEQAAWTVTARSVMNLDEFICRP